MRILALTRNQSACYFVEREGHVAEMSWKSLVRMLCKPHFRSVPYREMKLEKLVEWNGDYDWQKPYVISLFNELWNNRKVRVRELREKFNECWEWSEKGELA